MKTLFIDIIYNNYRHIYIIMSMTTINNTTNIIYICGFFFYNKPTNLFKKI